DGRAQHLGGAARDRVAEARQVRVRDLAVQAHLSRARAQRRPRAEQVHAEPRELLTRLVGVDLGDRRLVADGRAVAQQARRAVEEQAQRGDLGGHGGQPPAQRRIAAGARRVRVLDQPPRRASVLSASRSGPASGSLYPCQNVASPRATAGSTSRRSRSLPYSMIASAVCQEPASGPKGAPASASSSNSTSLKNIGRSWPPYATGQHMLIQPRSASAFMNARECAPEP